MAIQITEAALKKIKDFMASRNISPEKHFLRLGVKGGGCSGFSYAPPEFVTERGAGDKEFEFQFPESYEGQKLKVVINASSYLYLNGFMLDYKTEGLDEGFTFINPNAKSTCGCGESFST